MKIFKTENPVYRINFVDDSDVFLAYDFTEQESEDFGYSIHKGKWDGNAYIYEYSCLPMSELEDYSFDTDYSEMDEYGSRDVLTRATFRLIDQEENEIFLTLFNSHNGKNFHAFEMTQDGYKLFDGQL